MPTDRLSTAPQRHHAPTASDDPGSERQAGRWGCKGNDNHDRNAARPVLPRDHPGGGRGHAHEIAAAEGAARDRWPLAAGHALAAVAEAGATAVVVVIGPDRPDVASEVACAAALGRDRDPGRATRHRPCRARGAGRAGGRHDDVLVAFADTPLIQPQTFPRASPRWPRARAVAALGFEAQDPAGYGRFVTKDGDLEAIVEHKDATEAQRAIRCAMPG
jgi:hypothetical protein